jgi:WD40 repeat protein
MLLAGAAVAGTVLGDLTGRRAALEAGRLLAADEPAPPDQSGGEMPEVENGAVLEQEDKKLQVVLDTGGHTAQVLLVAFTPDGRELVTASQDGAIRLWDVDLGESLRVIYPPVWSLTAAALAPDGKAVAVAGTADGKLVIGLVNLETDKVTLLRGHRRWLSALTFSKDGKLLASASKEDNVHVWDVEKGTHEKELAKPATHAVDIAFGPDNEHVLVADLGGAARILTLADGTSEVVKGHEKDVRSVAWSVDGHIATGGPGLLRSTRRGRPGGKKEPDKPDKAAEKDEASNPYTHGVAFSSDGKRLLYAWSQDRKDKTGSVVKNKNGVVARVYGATIRDLETGRERRHFQPASIVRAMAVSPDDNLAATAGGAGHEVFVWQTSDARLIHRLGGEARMHFSAGWGADGKSICWGAAQGDRQEVFGGTVPLGAAFSLTDFAFVLPAQKPGPRPAPRPGTRPAPRGDHGAVL